MSQGIETCATTAHLHNEREMLSLHKNVYVLLSMMKMFSLVQSISACHRAATSSKYLAVSLTPKPTST